MDHFPAGYSESVDYTTVSRYFALKNVMLHKFSGSINSYDGYSRVGYERGRPYWFWSY